MAGLPGNGQGTVTPEMIELVAKKAGPGAVFGDPVVVGEVAVIPVATVSYGGGGGSGYGSGDMPEGDEAAPGHGEGGGTGFGFGVNARPVGSLEVTPTTVTYSPMIDYSRLAAIWSWISGIALLIFVLRLAFGRN